MLKCCEGRQLNKFLDMMNGKLDFLAKKKLGMQKSGFKDRLVISCRWLNNK